MDDEVVMYICRRLDRVIVFRVIKSSDKVLGLSVQKNVSDFRMQDVLSCFRIDFGRLGRHFGDFELCFGSTFSRVACSVLNTPDAYLVADIWVREGY